MSRQALRLIALFVFAATFAAFLPALSNSFINWDDTYNFLNNPHYRGLGLSQIRWMFSTFHLGHYQPVSWMTLGLDYLIWGLHPFGYHLTNLLLHCLNAVLFYFLALRLLASRDEDRSLPLVGGAVFSALFFSLHPLRVESVAWATERRDVLSAFFYLATIQAYLKGSKAALVFYPLALLSKVTAITLPAVLVILDFYPLKKQAVNLRDKIPFFLMALLAGAIGVFAQASTRELTHDYGVYLTQILYSLTFYVWKTAIPFSLSPWHELSYLETPTALTAATLAVFAVTALLWSARARRPRLLMAWVCYAAMIFPALGKIQWGRHIVDDRFSYLPCLAWALLAGALLSVCLRRASKHVPLLAAGVAAAWLAVLGGLTWRQTTLWHDGVTLWSHALSLAPESSMAQINLAIGLMQEERNEEALTYIERQIQLPQSPEMTRFLPIIGARALNNISVDLASQGKINEAIAHCRRALVLDPGSPEIRRNLGILIEARSKKRLPLGKMI